jgi:hypothetical protein
LYDCIGDSSATADLPIVVGTCNGGAAGHSADEWRRAFDPEAILVDTPWARRGIPVVSAGCASGMQALFLAFGMLARNEEVIVLAADILSPACHANFETLRILAASTQPPWRSGSEGFLLGEAAVALRLSRAGRGGLPIRRPVLSQDISGGGGLARVLARGTSSPALIVGQGTGPHAVDEQELAVLAGAYERRIPVTTSVVDFGHTLGSSSLLSVALVWASAELSPGTEVTRDGRPVARQIPRGPLVAVACRALGGACGLVEVGGVSLSPMDGESAWQDPAGNQPFAIPALRMIRAAAEKLRPSTPPPALVVWLPEPLLPAPTASRSGRLLPSSILEMTPGFAAVTVAGAWGYSGPTVCLIGGSSPGSRGAHDLGLGPDAYVFEIRQQGEPVCERISVASRAHAA